MTALDPAKFRDPARTLGGAMRARVALRGLDTLWVNTGTLCNLACAGCFMESSPRNERLSFITRANLAGYLAEIASGGLGTKLVGFTGGEPFINPELPGMLEDVLAAG
ncbi:MAG: radical SAM protein, partial [Janthinobacterium lividum]